MTKTPVNKVPPFALADCRECGGKAGLHHSRVGKWYVRCEKCKANKTEETVSRKLVCQLWNKRNGA